MTLPETLAGRRAALTDRLARTQEALMTALAEATSATRRAALARDIAGNLESAYIDLSVDLLGGRPALLASVETAHRMLRDRGIEPASMRDLRRRARQARDVARQWGRPEANLGDGRAVLAGLAAVHALTASTLVGPPEAERFVAWGESCAELSDRLAGEADLPIIPTAAQVDAFAAASEAKSR